MITVYSKSNCPECDKAKHWLKTNAFDFAEVRVDQDKEAREFVIGQGHRSVPVIYWDEVLIAAGYKDLLNLGVMGLEEFLENYE